MKVFTSDIEQGWCYNFNLSGMHKIGNESKQVSQFSEGLRYTVIRGTHTRAPQSTVPVPTQDTHT